MGKEMKEAPLPQAPCREENRIADDIVINGNGYPINWRANAPPSPTPYPLPPFLSFSPAGIPKDCQNTAQ